MKILHMYPDVMNLYGEYANLTILKRFLEECDTDVTIDSIALYEDKDIHGYDMYYMGSGTESNAKLVLKDIMRFQAELIKVKNDNRVILLTGNAMDIAGDLIEIGEERYKALGLSSFTTVMTENRITGDAVGHIIADEETYVVGFVNKSSHSLEVKEPWLRLEMGEGNCAGAREVDAKTGDDLVPEGVHENNMFCTHLTGPLLIKNPHILKKIACILLDSDEPMNHSILEQELGYEVTLNALLTRMGKN